MELMSRSPCTISGTRRAATWAYNHDRPVCRLRCWLSPLFTMSVSPLDILACILAVVLCKRLYFRGAKGNIPHPPGPPGLPLIGNLLDMPKNPAWSTYIHWSEKYGKSQVHPSERTANIHRVGIGPFECAGKQYRRGEHLGGRDRPPGEEVGQLFG